MSDCVQSTKVRSLAPIDEETSKRITSLRFLLIVFVVLLHSDLQSFNVSAFLENGVLREGTVYCPNVISEWVQFFITEGIARCAVPLFFMFSAYLQFKKNDPYKTLIKKRTKSLVVPWFLWTTIFIATEIVMKLGLSYVVPSFFVTPDVIPYISEYSLLDWIKAYFGNYSNFSINEDVFAPSVLGLFWFVRDLFIMVLISPFITKIARNFPIETAVFALFFFVCGFRPVIVHSQALLFYLIGFYWAEYDFDLFAFADRCKWESLIPVFTFFVILKKMFWNAETNAFVVFSSILIVLKFSKMLIQNKRVFAVTKYLSGFSFFLYAIHSGFVKAIIARMIIGIFPMNNPFFVVFDFFGIAFSKIVLGTLIGIVLKKVCPRLFAVLTGGR